MQARERIIYSDSYMLLCEDKITKSKWLLKKIVVTQNSFMAFNSTSKIFNDCDMKIIFNKHEGFYATRDDFIAQTNMEDKEQVGYLSFDFKHLVIFVDLNKKEYHLVGAKSEEAAKKLLTAIIMANRFQEILSYADQMKYPLNPYYLDYIISSCTIPNFFFMIKPSMIANESEELFLKHFLSKGEFIENVQIEGFDMMPDEIEKISIAIVSVPQQQIRQMIIKDCKLSDDGLVAFGRTFRHNSYLKMLCIDKITITDKSLKMFSGIWQYMPFLENVHIINCKQLKGEQYFGGFLNSIAVSLQLELLDLSGNSFSEMTINTFVEEIFNVKNLMIKKLDLSHNCFTPRENWIMFQLYLKSPVKPVMQLVLAPYPIHEAYFNELTAVGKKFQTIIFERVSLTAEEKRKALNPEDLSVCKDIIEEINQCVLFQKTIEDILQVCKKIQSLPFDFPPQYIERLSELIRELINNTYQAEDYYGFEVVYDCSLALGMNKSEGRKKMQSLKNKADQIVEDMNRLVNFQTQEAKLNTLLTDLVNTLVNRDMRGPGVDVILMVKEIRDSFIMSYLGRSIDQQAVENEMMEKEPFFLLESNDALEERSKYIDERQVNSLIGCHPKVADYPKISELTRDRLLKEFFDFNTSQDIVNKASYDRMVFLLVSPKEQTFTVKFKLDYLLGMTKTLIFYRWSLSLKKGTEMNLAEKISYLADKNNTLFVVETQLFKQLTDYKESELKLQQELSDQIQTYPNCQFATASDVQALQSIMDYIPGVLASSKQKLQYDTYKYEHGVAICGLIAPLLQTNFYENQEGYLLHLAELMRFLRGPTKIKADQRAFVASETFLYLIQMLCRPELTLQVVRNGSPFLLSALSSELSFKFYHC